MAQSSKNERKYLDAVRGQAAYLWIIDLVSGTVFQSPGFATRFGFVKYPPGQRLAFWAGIIHPEDRAMVLSAYSGCVDSVTPEMKVEYRLRDTEGHYVWLFSHVRLLQGHDGKPEKLIGADMDITERRTMENGLRQAELDNKVLLHDLAEKNRQLTEYFTNISHEFRTPLSILLVEQELMELYADDEVISREKLKQQLAISRQNMLRLLRLVNNIIDLSKIESGFVTLDLRDVDLTALLGEMVDLVGNYARKKFIQIRLSENLDGLHIAADSDKVERVMLNLLSNAIKHTPEGGSIEVTLENDAGKNVMISVKDSGEGIPEEKKAMIFQRFRQAHSSLTYAGEGSGIGLSLSKELIEMHGGGIWFESELGHGTVFHVSLPIAQKQGAACAGAYLEGPPMEKRIEIEFSDLFIY